MSRPCSPTGPIDRDSRLAAPWVLGDMAGTLAPNRFCDPSKSGWLLSIPLLFWAIGKQSREDLLHTYLICLVARRAQEKVFSFISLALRPEGSGDHSRARSSSVKGENSWELLAVGFNLKMGK